MTENSKIFIADSKGMVESALTRALDVSGHKNWISAALSGLDLLSQAKVTDFFKREKPDIVFLIGGKSAGIKANIEQPADLIYNNLQIQTNVIHAAHESGVEKLLYLGSSCIYPKLSPQPIKEEYLLSERLERTSQPYAIAKLAGIEMVRAYGCQYGENYIAAIPATIYGPGDSFDAENSHVISSLIRKFHEAKVNSTTNMTIWGSGNARREFLYVDDIADACIYLMKYYRSADIMNIGSGNDVSIRELSILIKEIVQFRGEVVFDTSKPEGVLQKLLDSSKINSLGWRPKTSLEDGIRGTYQWFTMHSEK